MLDFRRPVGVGRVPSHSVGRPAFRSPAATAAARSAAISGGGPPSLPRPFVRLVGLALLRRLDARRLALLLRVVGRPRGVAQALGLVAGAELEQPVERADGVVDAGAGVATLAEQRRHGRQREVLRDDLGHLVPAQRERHPGVGERPDRVGGRHGPVLRVLVVVEEHPVALLLPPLGGRDRGRTPLDVARERERRPPNLAVGPAALDAHVDVDAPRPRRLRPADQPHRVEGLVDDAGHVAHLRPGHARHRVEVDAQLVGVLHVVGAHGVRVEVDAAEVRDPREARRLVDDDLVGRPTRRERQRRDAHPLGPVVGRPLLEERLLVDPVDEPLERHRPAADARQRPVGDGDEVGHHVELGVAGLGEVDLVGVRDRDLAAADLEHLLARRHGRHARTAAIGGVRCRSF